MRGLLPFVVAGLASGSLYGLAGAGLVLTYKTSGVFNFAHGTVASLGAYAFYELRVRRHVPWPVAAVICLLALGPAAGLLLERLGRALARATPAMKVVATVGLLLALQGGLRAVYGTRPRPFARFLPTGVFRVAGVVVGWDQVLTVVLASGATAALAWFFRASRVGMSMRALVDDRDLLELSGSDAVRIGRLSWAIGATFAVASGILIAPALGLDVNLLTLLVVQAFGAAAVGRFSDLRWTFAGGLLVGVAAAVTQRYTGDIRSLVGLPASLPFVVLFVVLVAQRGGGAVERLRSARESTLARAPVTGARAVAGVAFVGALCAIPFVVGPRIPVYTQGLVFVLVFLSLSLLVHTSGQISLCHAGFVAVGAAAFGHLTAGAGLPWPVGVLGAGLVAVPIGAVVAIPAIRLSGVYLALATFGFGILLQRMAYPARFMFGAFGFRTVRRPSIGHLALAGDRGYYFVVLVVVLAAAALMLAIGASRLGRLLRAMSDSPVTLESTGVDVVTTRVLVFCIAAFLAGVAGALFSSATGAADQNSYDAFSSLVWLAVLVIAGASTVRAAFVAAGLLTVLPSYITGDIANAQLIAFGSVAILTAVLSTLERPLSVRLDDAIAAAAGSGSRSPFRARAHDSGGRRHRRVQAPVAAEP